MKKYKLPSGEYTKDVQECVKAWEELAKPIVESTGAILAAFDPDLVFTFKGERIFIPVGFAKKLGEALTE